MAIDSARTMAVARWLTTDPSTPYRSFVECPSSGALLRSASGLEPISPALRLIQYRLDACITLATGAAHEQQKVGKSAAAQGPAPVHGFSVVRSYPHDPQAFTQGLEYVDGVLYESTGLNGRSGIRKVNLNTGEVLQIQPLDAAYFGEGITVWKNRIIQLTWQSGLGFVYDRQTFQQQRTFKYTGEGWGLTHDGTRLLMSDGSESGTLRWFEPETLRQVGALKVTDAGRPVARLNELEFVKGEIFANI